MPEQPAPQPEQKPMPEWVEDTPGESTYNLTMFDQGGESLQDIDLNREEFIALKQYLAVMRNHPVAREPWGEDEWALLERAYGAMKQLCG